MIDLEKDIEIDVEKFSREVMELAASCSTQMSEGRTLAIWRERRKRGTEEAYLVPFDNHAGLVDPSEGFVRFQVFASSSIQREAFDNSFKKLKSLIDVEHIHRFKDVFVFDVEIGNREAVRYELSFSGLKFSCD